MAGCVHRPGMRTGDEAGSPFPVSSKQLKTKSGMYTVQRFMPGEMPGRMYAVGKSISPIMQLYIQYLNS